MNLVAAVGPQEVELRLNHADVAELGALIRRIRDEWRVTVLLVERHVGMVMSTADRVVALNFGRKIAEGTPA